MASTWWDDDDLLLAALSEVLRKGSPPVPPRVLEAAQAAYSWRNIDAELATLAYDSALDADLLTQVRSAVSMRVLTFESETMSLQLGVGDDGLQGQLLPPESWQVELTTPDGTLTSVVADHLGRFAIRPLPLGPVRLACRTADGHTRMTTEWVTV